jgi:hypothetical protein
MHESLDRETVLRLLAKLRRRDSKRSLFGSAAHDYKLNPPIPASTIQEFEARHGSRLPDDYRYFVTEIGNGGAGPYYGLLPFGQLDDGRSWEEGDLIGDVSQPFPHVEPWNLPGSFWEQQPDMSPDTPPEEVDRLMEAWDKVEREHYFNSAIMNGAIPICHLGCGLWQWLVVNGEQKGSVWNDSRSDHGGISPLQDESGEQMTFSDWYMSWLNRSLQSAGLKSMITGLLRRRTTAAGYPITHRTRRRDVLTLLGLIIAGVLLGLAMALLRR